MLELVLGKGIISSSQRIEMKYFPVAVLEMVALLIKPFG